MKIEVTEHIGDYGQTDTKTFESEHKLEATTFNGFLTVYRTVPEEDPEVLGIFRQWDTVIVVPDDVNHIQDGTDTIKT